MREGRLLVIGGTDTGVGKTVVGAGLAVALSGRGHDVVAVKPVESGCADLADDEEDGAILAAATGQEWPRSALTRLAAPLAPPVAAELEGAALGPRRWIRDIEELTADRDIVLVEGAGGVLSPLAWGFTLRELARDLGAPVLVVSCDRLGTLNQTLMTIEILARAGVRLVGVVLNAPDTADRSTGRNAEALRRCGIERLIEMPRLDGGSVDAARAAEHLAPLVDRLERTTTAP